MRYRFTAALAAASLLLAVAAVAGCTGNPRPQPRQAQPSAAQPSLALTAPESDAGCAGQPPVSPLPAWARAGFTPPDIAMPHVIGAAGNIVAILWVTPNALRVPPLPDRTNKILWVSRVLASGPMTIRATLAGSTRTATMTLPDGPGPSYVDMPAPGCWTLHLTWGGHSDQVSLRYVR